MKLIRLLKKEQEIKQSIVLEGNIQESKICKIEKLLKEVASIFNSEFKWEHRGNSIFIKLFLSDDLNSFKLSIKIPHCDIDYNVPLTIEETQQLRDYINHYFNDIEEIENKIIKGNNEI